MNFDKEYFIKKFEAIPEEEWGSGGLMQKCAFYHCGVTVDSGGYSGTEESRALIQLFGGTPGAVIRVNDKQLVTKKGLETPKKRMLDYLYNIH